MNDRLATTGFHGDSHDLMARAHVAARNYAAAEDRRRDDLDRLVSMLKAVAEERDQLAVRAESAESRASLAEGSLVATSERYTTLLQDHRQLAGAFDMFVEVVGRRSGDILKEDLGIESAVLLAKAKETFGVERPAEPAAMIAAPVALATVAAARIPGAIDVARSAVTVVEHQPERNETDDIRDVVARFGQMFEQPQGAAAQ